MNEDDSKQLDELLDEVEAIFKKTKDSFEFVVESFQHVLTARDVHQQISGERFTIADFYDFIGDKRAIEVKGDYLTENWRRVIPFLLPMLQEGQLTQLTDVIIDDPLINSIAEVTGHKMGEKPIIVHAHTYVCNPDAYFVLANVYEHLAKTYGVDLICMEGAEGPVDTSLLWSFPDPKIKRETGEYLVKQGKLSAPELVSITSESFPHPRLIGLEDGGLYAKLQKFEAGGKRSADLDGVYDMARRRGQRMLENLNKAIELWPQVVMVVESQSVGVYAIPDLMEETGYTIIEIRPRVSGGINWKLYNKIVRGEKTPVEKLLEKNVA